MRRLSKCHSNPTPFFLSGIILVLLLSVVVPWWATIAGQGSLFAGALWNVANYSSIAGMVAGIIFGIATIWKLWRQEHYEI
jgi:hypothetical protein